jgi:hypothetical protein
MGSGRGRPLEVDSSGAVVSDSRWASGRDRSLEVDSSGAVVGDSR